MTSPHLRGTPAGISPNGPATACLLFSALLAGCGGADAADRRADEVPRVWREAESPALDDAGEPFLSSTGDGVLMSWIEPAPSGGHRVRVATLAGGTWSEPGTVTEGDSLFVNWADFPTVRSLGEGRLVAHWLRRGPGEGLDYGVRVARSADGGRTWQGEWTPHEDGLPAEHGFVSIVPLPGGATGFLWLDGRRYARGTREMTLRWREHPPGGPPGPEVLVDGLTCDCCQTDAVALDSAVVAVYRDRTEEEVRDIHVARLVDGAWREEGPIHRDGWVINACPVNGPAVDGRGRAAAVAWFTAAADTPRVKVAFSTDAGATFGPPVRVDGGNPSGRVDLVMLEDGSAAVSWLERVGTTAEVRIARVEPGPDGGRVTGQGMVGRSTDARASGFPRMAASPGGGLVLAWTDAGGEVSRIRVGTVDPSLLSGGGS